MSDAFQIPSPVVLSSVCSVARNNNASPNMAELSYPYRKAVLIDEIRFSMYTDGNDAFNQGAFVYAKFQLGQHYLMRDPVPVWLLGTSMDAPSSAQSVEELLDTTVNPNQMVSHYRWRLPEPLYVEAGQVLRPVFNVNNPTATPAGNTNVQVTYCGSVVPPNRPRPRVIAVPYVAPFVTTYGNTYQQSNEYHLYNPFNKALRVQRLTGRLMDEGGGSTLVAGRGPTPAVVANSITVQMDDSWGGKMVRDFTGPGDVFDIFRAGWTVDTIMPPKGVYNVRAWNIGATQQLHIALVGVREEAL